MAKHCEQCGKVLQTEDARFCSNCGTPVTSQAPEAGLSSKEEAPKKEKGKPALREQIAQQPPARSDRRTLPNEPPAWISKLEVSNRPPAKPKEKPVEQSGGVEQKKDMPLSPSWPPPVTHVVITETSRTNENASEPQPAPPAAPQKLRPDQELRVRVWEEREKTPLPVVPMTGKEQIDDQEIEDLPTMPLIPSTEPPEVQEKTSSTKSEEDDRSEVEKLDTVQLVTPRPRWPQLPDTPRPAALSQEPASERQASRQLAEKQPRPEVKLAERQRPVDFQNHPPIPLPLTASRTGGLQTKKRSPAIAFGLIILLLLVVGGVIAVWVAVAHPFNIPEASQPVQIFQDTQLGIVLSYPTGWQRELDRGKSLLHLRDSSNSTVTVDISVSNVPGGDVPQQLQNQATLLKMSKTKTLGQIEFAGEKWQQIQGNIQRDGANYTGTIMATVHGNRLFILTQVAQEGIYSDIEREVFLPLRLSFRFLG